jgi:hypothetical protein
MCLWQIWLFLPKTIEIFLTGKLLKEKDLSLTYAESHVGPSLMKYANISVINYKILIFCFPLSQMQGTEIFFLGVKHAVIISHPFSLKSQFQTIIASVVIYEFRQLKCIFPH